VSRELEVVYDPEADALVIRARGGKPAYGRELAGRIIVHFDERGEPVEIELLDATELLAKLAEAVESAKRAARPPTPAEKHLELALKLLEEGRALIEKDPARASRKLYRAAEEAVKALAAALELPEAREAAERGRWSSQLLFDAASELAEKLGDDVRRWWNTAWVLRVEGYREARLKSDAVRENAKDVEALVNLARAVAEAPGAPGEAPPAAEWPEVAELALKLARGEKLSEREEAWLDELARETGWSREEVAEELASAGADPSSRVERYREVFERCYREALELAGRDTRQAGEKAWGAAVALVKLHAAAKRVPIAHWDHGRLYNYVASSVESEHRELFRNLLRAAHVLHEHFYEGHLDAETFSQHFNDAVKLIEEAAKALGLRGAAAKPRASG
jgi:uncharacterized protein YuzE